MGLSPINGDNKEESVHLINDGHQNIIGCYGSL